MTEESNLVEFKARKDAAYKELEDIFRGLFKMFAGAKKEICQICPDDCNEEEHFSLSQKRFFEICIKALLSFVTDTSKKICLENL